MASSRSETEKTGYHLWMVQSELLFSPAKMDEIGQESKGCDVSNRKTEGGVCGSISLTSQFPENSVLNTSGTVDSPKASLLDAAFRALPHISVRL